MRGLIGSVGALVFAACGVVIVGAAIHTLWLRGDHPTAVMAGVFFPVTYFVWPWEHVVFGYPVWYFFIASIVGYWAMNFIGGADGYG